MGIGDWGLGIGDWGLGPIPNPHEKFYINNIVFILINKYIIMFYFHKIKYDK
jgi:hypothetical protein